MTAVGPDLGDRHAKDAVAKSAAEASIIAEVVHSDGRLDRKREALNQLFGGPKLYDALLRKNNLLSDTR